MRRKDFDLLVESALRRIPRRFRRALKDIRIVVEDWPDPDLMGQVMGDRAAVIYGLFTGKPLIERHYDDWGELPPVIYLYRKPLEEDFPCLEELAREVEITLVHEIAHFMGFSEETLRKYGYE